MVSLGDYFAKVYLPFAESTLRHWTVKSYGVTWAKHFVSRPHITRKLLCDVRTSDIYGWLHEIVTTDRTENGGTLGSATVKRLKSLLSGVFTHAVNLGYLKRGKPGCGRDAACCYAAARNRRLFPGTDTGHDRRTA